MSITKKSIILSGLLAIPCILALYKCYDNSMISDPVITHVGGESTNALSGRLNFEQDLNRIIGRDSAALPRLIIRGDDNNFDMKVSKPGFDVINATDDQLIFNSNQNILKIAATDTYVMPTVSPGIPGTPNVVSFLINTGVSSSDPLIAIAYMDSGFAGRSQLPFLSLDNGGVVDLQISCASLVISGIVNIEIRVQAFGVGIVSQNVKWYLLQETSS